jgi:prevent-host-death family protein
MARSTVSRPLDELAEKGEVDAGDQHRRCSARQLRDTGPGAARGPGGCMTGADAHTVGLRDLRHHTSEVLARVRHGETVDVTEHGRLIARIVPAGEREPTPVLAPGGDRPGDPGPPAWLPAAHASR